MRYARVLTGVVLVLGLVAPAASAPTPTSTLDETIVATAEGTFQTGPGELRVARSLEAWADPGGRGRALAGLKQVSDIHVLDEESPGRVEYFDSCLEDFASAYRPQEALTTQVADQMLRRLALIEEGPATGVPLSSLVSTGDNIDSSQYNETRWFIDLLDGEVVEPNSGAATYDGYTQEQFSGALPTDVLELAQEPFDSVGAKGRWYAVLGNHDGLIQGNIPASDLFNGLVVGDRKVFDSVENYDDCPENTDEATNKAVIAILNRYRVVPADQGRRFLSHKQTVAQYFDTTGMPEGHGFANAPTDPVHDSRAGYYSWNISRKVRGISLDTISYDGGPGGSVPHQQYKWLERQLKKWSKRYVTASGEVRQNKDGRDRLIVLFSHHSSVTLNNPGVNEAEVPYHCFTPQDVCCPDEEGTCADGAGLRDLLMRYPNVIAWVNGHEHSNAIRPYEPAQAEPPGWNGFWEINTASHIDWPQQSRLIEFAWKPGQSGDTVIIYGTVVDHPGPLVPDRATQTTTEYLAAVSRLQSYRDACIRTNQADCTAPGAPEDRNVRLVSRAPFDLGS